MTENPDNRRKRVRLWSRALLMMLLSFYSFLSILILDPIGMQDYAIAPFMFSFFYSAYLVNISTNEARKDLKTQQLSIKRIYDSPIIFMEQRMLKRNCSWVIIAVSPAVALVPVIAANRPWHVRVPELTVTLGVAAILGFFVLVRWIMDNKRYFMENEDA